MAILEAMACGVPVVTTNLAGPAFLVDDKGGRLVPPDDSDALAKALIEILQSSALRAAMGCHNRAVVERRFTWDRVLDALEGAYHATLDQTASQHARVLQVRTPVEVSASSEVVT